MSAHDTTYLDLLRRVMTEGEPRRDRTGTGTLSLFGVQSRYDFADGFPLLTTKRVHFKSVAAELLWFLSGDTNVAGLHEHGVTIWDEWADDDGELGPVYGKQWRKWEHPRAYDGESNVDQIKRVIDSIRTDPYSRRHIVSAWNPAEIEDMALPPCHMIFQFYVGEDDSLDLHLYQRSGDMFLGVPFNIASYSLLLLMVAQVTGLRAREFVHTIGDAHLYANHVEQAAVQLARVPRSAPAVTLTHGIDTIDAFTLDDVTLSLYDPHPGIKAEVAV